MKTLNKIVLLSPGMDDTHSGPDPGWIEKLGTNLNLVLKKYTGDSLITITAEYKEAADLLNKQVFLFIVMHESYSSATKYMKFLEKISADDDLKVGYLVRIDSSVRIAGKVPEPVVNASSIDLFESSKDQVEGTWLDDESQVYWSRLLDLAARVAGKRPGDHDRLAGQRGWASVLVRGLGSAPGHAHADALEPLNGLATGLTVKEAMDARGDPAVRPGDLQGVTDIVPGRHREFGHRGEPRQEQLTALGAYVGKPKSLERLRQGLAFRSGNRASPHVAA